MRRRGISDKKRGFPELGAEECEEAKEAGIAAGVNIGSEAVVLKL